MGDSLSHLDDLLELTIPRSSKSSVYLRANSRRNYFMHSLLLFSFKTQIADLEFAVEV